MGIEYRTTFPGMLFPPLKRNIFTGDECTPTLALLGTCADDLWREEHVIPALPDDVDYFTPNMGVGGYEGRFREDYQAIERWFVQHSGVLLVNISERSDSTVSMVEVLAGLALILSKTPGSRYVGVRITSTIGDHVDKGKAACSHSMRLTLKHYLGIHAESPLLTIFPEETSMATMTHWAVDAYYRQLGLMRMWEDQGAFAVRKPGYAKVA
ncbi:MAG: hypothetical protein WAX89_01640 [Alphaproteobacteria bacterium]